MQVYEISFSWAFGRFFWAQVVTFFLPDLMWVESDFPGSKRSVLVIQNHVEEERIVLQSHHFSGVFNSQTSTSGGYYPFMFQPRKSRNLFGLWRRDGFLKSLSHLKRPGYIYIIWNSPKKRNRVTQTQLPSLLGGFFPTPLKNVRSSKWVVRKSLSKSLSKSHSNDLISEQLRDLPSLGKS